MDSKRFFYIFVVGSLISVYLLLNVVNNFVIHHDDFSVFSFSHKLFQDAEQGRYISEVVRQILLFYIPNLLNIHPNEILINQIVMGVNFSLVGLLLTLILCYKKDKKYFFIIYPIMILIVYFLSDDSWYVKNVQHFAYLFPMIIYILFWYQFFKMFSEGRYPSLFSKYLLLVFAVSISNHITMISSFGSIAFILFTVLIYNYIQIKDNFKIKDVIVNHIVHFWSYYFVFFLGLFILISAPHFQKQFYTRGESLTLIDLIKLLIPFISDYIKVVLLSIPNFIILLMSGLIIFYQLFIRKTKDIQIYKNLLIGIAIIVGGMFFNFILIRSGRTFYDSYSFWFVSTDIRSVTSIIFFTGFLVLFNTILSPVLNKRVLFIYPIVAVLASYLSISKLNMVYEYNKKLKLIKKEIYIAESMILFYNEKNIEPIIPSYKSLGDKSLQNECIYPGYQFLLEYMGTLYDLKYKTYITTNEAIAIAIYSNYGGTFTDGELNNIDFNRLYKSYR